MEANTRDLERIFDQTIAYQIPLFQRPYVWNEEINWEPLWIDIQMLLDRQLTQDKCHTHFLGAVVFEQMGNATGSIESRQVIDGQQRLTTLQLFLIAARDFCAELGNEKYVERFTDLTENKESRIDDDIDRFKVWPTNSDRQDFVATHQGRSPQNVLVAFDRKGKAKVGNNIPDGYLYFSERIRQWFAGQVDDQADSTEYSLDERLEALWQVVRSKLQIVVIDLDSDDESQVIFETLNARGTQLLPADLVKNYLFHKAEKLGENVEVLYNKSWSPFDTDFWREEVNQGRLKRPRIDLFLQHYLSLQTLDEVRVAHLFNAFKRYAEDTIAVESNIGRSLSSPGEQLQSLAEYGKVFDGFYRPTPGSRLATFISRLNAVDTATVYPFLLEACYTLAVDHPEELDRILICLESYLIRRMICGLTSKNYNKLFIDLVKASSKSGRVIEAEVIEFLLRGKGDSVRFPDDEEFAAKFLDAPIYRNLAQYKVRAVLEALDAEFYENKSESMDLPSNLTIEHVMPQKWEQHWGLEARGAEDPLAIQKAKDYRDSKIHTLGNLTLITGSLNPSLSNSSWKTKRPELMKFSKLNLNRYFHDKEQWDELEISTRASLLLEKAKSIWPFPMTDFS